jgi:phage tail sheath protein FI
MATFPTINKAPGVYVQEITLPGPIPGVSTSNTAFVGPAAMGPLLKPVQLTSIEQFNAIFGPYVEDPYRVFAAHAVNGFFAEGGQLCYFVRVGTGVQATLKLVDRATPAPQAALKVTAVKEGTGGNSITVQVDDAQLASTTLSKPQAVPLSTAGDKKSITVTLAADAATFLPGDVVIINQLANTDTTTVSSVSGAVINFQAAIANNYTGGTMHLADVAAGTKRIRVVDAAKIEPGSYVTISDGTNTETGVVRVVTTVTNASPVPNLNLLTLTDGLQNTFKLGGGDPAVTVKSAEFKLTIVSASAGTEIFDNLSMDSRHSRYFDTVVKSTAVKVELWDPPSTSPPAKNLPKSGGGAVNLSGGAADNLSAITPLNYHAGIDALKKINDVNLLCVPDAVGAGFPNASDTQDVQAYMIAHCEQQQDRFAILDPRKPDPSDITFAQIDAQRSALNSDNGYAALYFPWIAISNPFAKGQINVPPSGHIAGVYSNSDSNFGVFRAPANEQITSALAVQITLSDAEQGPRNEKGINVIRSFPNQGIKIWGARTIAPSDVTAWRFINVRRLTTFIEKSIQAGTRFAVFLPNNLALWQQVKRIVTDFLHGQWASGALFGDTPDKAFRVRVDEIINPPEVTALGQLIVQVTIRPTTPAEFIIFQVIQDITGSSLQEKAA